MLSVEKTLKQEIEQWKHKYEVLDACCELAQGKIAELKAENDRLKARKDKYYQQTLDDEIQINELLHTLQEIKTIAEKLMADNLCNNCDGIGLDANCQDTGCPYYQMDNILQKITKAEEE